MTADDANPEAAPDPEAALEPEAREAFEALAAGVLGRPGVTRATMMGHPSLRVGGAFFASFVPQTGAFVVKLPERRVAELVAAGDAEPFAPRGRAFREWAAVPPDDAARWPDLLEEALTYVAGA